MHVLAVASRDLVTHITVIQFSLNLNFCQLQTGLWEFIQTFWEHESFKHTVNNVMPSPLYSVILWAKVPLAGYPSSSSVKSWLVKQLYLKQDPCIIKDLHPPDWLLGRGSQIEVWTLAPLSNRRQKLPAHQLHLPTIHICNWVWFWAGTPQSEWSRRMKQLQAGKLVKPALLQSAWVIRRTGYTFPCRPESLSLVFYDPIMPLLL